MRLACVTKNAVLDQGAWAKTWPGLGGAGYYLTRALQELSLHIDFIGPLEEHRAFLAPLKSVVYDRLLGTRYYPWGETSVFRDYARQVSGEVSRLCPDLVLCPENAMPIAYLKCRQPIVLWTDAPLAALFDYYEYLSNLCRETRNSLLRMEASALQRCARVLYSSEWAAEAAIRHYAVEPSKLKVVPWGANLDPGPTPRETRIIVDTRPPQPCRLLFVGMRWWRKGGDTALAVAKQLNTLGLQTELTIVGCKPTTAEPLPSFVNVLGFLDKSTRQDRDTLQRAFAGSHFLILPSRADCTPLVIGEANAFGVPCLATSVGGMATLMQDGRNGRLFSKEASATDYCDYILSLMRDYQSYKGLALSALHEYESRLNWTAAARVTKDVLEDLM